MDIGRVYVMWRIGRDRGHNGNGPPKKIDPAARSRHIVSQGEASKYQGNATDLVGTTTTLEKSDQHRARRNRSAVERRRTATRF